MAILREDVDAVYRSSFGAFVYQAFEILNPGRKLIPSWHIDCICHRLQAMVDGQNNDRRLVVNLPPRTLKTFIVSVCFVAWLLGRDPTSRIVCASYAADLSEKLSRDCRALVESKFYKRVFPRTRLNPKKANEGEFETTRRGYRLATSIAGTLTGRGGDVIIVDDPLKAGDGDSVAALRGVNDWYNSTVNSRLDDKSRGLTIVTMQRLHVGDLAGMLIESGWPALAIPAIATEPTDYLVAADEVYHRPAGEVLQPDRDRREIFDQIKRQIGSRHFAAQYQQNPAPTEGNLINANWLVRYSPASSSEFDRIVLSCDPAGKAGTSNDYTALVVAGLIRNRVYILDVTRGHWTIMQMVHHIKARAARWNVALVMIEDTATGMGLIQLLREQSERSVVGRQPNGDKVTRVLRQQAKFEAGQVLLPMAATWLADFERELLSFPNGKNDDQVDALIQILEWYTPGRMRNEVDLGLPVQAKCEPFDPFSGVDDSRGFLWS